MLLSRCGPAYTDARGAGGLTIPERQRDRAVRGNVPKIEAEFGHGTAQRGRIYGILAVHVGLISRADRRPPQRTARRRSKPATRRARSDWPRRCDQENTPGRPDNRRLPWTRRPAAARASRAARTSAAPAECRCGASAARARPAAR